VDVEPQPECEQAGSTQGNRIVAAAMFLVPLAVCEDVFACQLRQECVTNLLFKQGKLNFPPPGGSGIQVLAFTHEGLNSGVQRRGAFRQHSWVCLGRGGLPEFEFLLELGGGCSRMCSDNFRRCRFPSYHRIPSEPSRHFVCTIEYILLAPFSLKYTVQFTFAIALSSLLKYRVQRSRRQNREKYERRISRRRIILSF
jgi:hypothetical protein